MVPLTNIFNAIFDLGQILKRLVYNETGHSGQIKSDAWYRFHSVHEYKLQKKFQKNFQKHFEKNFQKNFQKKIQKNFKN